MTVVTTLDRPSSLANRRGAMPLSPIRPRPSILALVAVGAAVIAGLALRIALARGALWLDEAWSAVFAREAVTPVGALFRIAHDNNHPLNTIWLQATGWGAPPMLQRALSIVSGTAAIVLAATIAGRRSVPAMVAAAWLFALSPMLVTYGAEARGYAPMLCAVLAAILLVGRWLDDTRVSFPAFGVAIVMLVATMAQFTALVALAAITGWVFLAAAPRTGVVRAAAFTLRALGPAILLSVAVVALIVLTAELGGGFRFGAYDAFAWASFLRALRSVLVFTVGSTDAAWWPLPLALAIGALVLDRRDHRLHLYGFAIIAFPLSVALLHLGNSGIARYYLVSSIALLLLTADIVARLWSNRGIERIAAVALIAAIATGSLVNDLALIRSLRGDPGAAIVAMRRRAPTGASVEIDRSRSSAILDAAGASAGYAVTATQTPCPAPRFYFAERDGAERYPDPPQACGRYYHPIAGATPVGLSGTDWRLYERVR